jgi:translation initiation factor IF-2
MTARVIPHTKARPALRALGVLLMLGGVALPSLWSLAQKPPSSEPAALARPLSPEVAAHPSAAHEAAPPSTSRAALGAAAASALGASAPPPAPVAASPAPSGGRAFAPGHRPTPAAFSAPSHEGAGLPHRAASGARSASPRGSAARKAETVRPTVVSDEPYGLPPRNSEAWGAGAPAVSGASSARPRLLVEEPPRVKVLE